MPKKNTYLTATDQFCGAGGSTSGAKSAGVEVKMALNHWNLAIETHNTNHPETQHDCTDIQACDPRRYPSTDILITSPECTNHSLAKGKKKGYQQKTLFDKPDPAAERSRATMWDVVRFAEFHHYNCIIVENVVDARKWVLWEPWLKAMHNLGYRHKCCFFNSMFFHPTPQSRDRMYVVFWKKGNKAPDLDYMPVSWCPACEKNTYAYQAWKKNKYGKYKQQYNYRCESCYEVVKPYYFAAFNCIDWSIPGERIGDRKKPLSKKTMQRIQAGLKKYGNDYLIVNTNYGPTARNCCKTVGHPLPTQTTFNGQAIVAPFVINSNYGSGIECSVRSGLGPMDTQTSFQEKGVVMPQIVSNYLPGYSKPVTSPVGSITTSDHHGVLSSRAWNSFISSYYSCGNGNKHVFEQMPTVTTRDRNALVNMEDKIEDCYYRMLQHHEIKRAMAFDDDYIILGNSKQKVKQLGNAVTPPVMEWIVRRVTESLC